jgi:hypothetical protein
MRVFAIVGVLIALGAPAIAQTGERGKASVVQPRTRGHVIVRPNQGRSPPVRFSVPGWSDEQTRQWLDNATSCEGCG